MIKDSRLKSFITELGFYHWYETDSDFDIDKNSITLSKVSEPHYSLDIKKIDVGSYLTFSFRYRDKKTTFNFSDESSIEYSVLKLMEGFKEFKNKHPFKEFEKFYDEF